MLEALPGGSRGWISALGVSALVLVALGVIAQPILNPDGIGDLGNVVLSVMGGDLSGTGGVLTFVTAVTLVLVIALVPASTMLGPGNGNLGSRAVDALLISGIILSLAGVAVMAGIAYLIMLGVL